MPVMRFVAEAPRDEIFGTLFRFRTSSRMQDAPRRFARICKYPEGEYLRWRYQREAGWRLPCQLNGQES